MKKSLYERIFFVYTSFSTFTNRGMFPTTTKENTMKKEIKNLLYGKNGELVYVTKEGTLIEGLSKAQFSEKATTSDQKKEAMKNFYCYKASISKLRALRLHSDADMYLKKAEDALKVKSEEEKIKEQIANSEKKIQELKKKLKDAGSK
jgi:uncharacterized protein YgiM (DUF1202 family)